MTSNNDPAPTVEFYWRPGCPFCSMLERKLVKANIKLDKKNIWDSKSHAEFVRSVADGNETVPTVVVDGNAMVNPRAAEVISLVDPSAEATNTKGILRRLVGE